MPLPKDSTLLIRTKSALGLKYVEITRGRSDDGFGDGDTIPLEPADARAGRVRRVREHVRRRDARRRCGRTSTASATAFAGRGTSINEAIAALPAAAGGHHPRRAEPVGPEHQPRALHRTSSATPPPRSRRWPRSRPSCSSTSTRRSARCARSRARTSRTRSPRAGRRSTRRSARSRSSARSCANSEGLFRELRPGVRALRTSAPVLADALEIGTPTLRRSVALNRRLEPLLRELQTFAEDPLVRARRRRADRRRAHAATRRSQHLAPAQLQCNYVTLWFRNVSSLLSEGDKQRHLAAVHHHRHAAGPEQRGRPVLGARRRPDGRQPPAHQPVPEHGLAGPAEGVRGRQRALRARQDRDRQRARHAAGDRRRRRARDGTPGAVKRHTPRSPVAIGLIALVIILVATFLGLHEGHPVHDALPGQGDVRVGQLDPRRLARPDRRRQRRQGRQGRGRARTPTRRS